MLVEELYLLLAIVVAGITVIAPIVKLNSSIMKLTILLERLERDHKRHDKRLNSHSDKLDDLGHRLTKLEMEEKSK